MSKKNENLHTAIFITHEKNGANFSGLSSVAQNVGHKVAISQGLLGHNPQEHLIPFSHPSSCARYTGLLDQPLLEIYTANLAHMLVAPKIKLFNGPCTRDIVIL